MLFGKRTSYWAATGNFRQPHIMSAFVGPNMFLYTFLLRTVMNHEDGSTMLLRTSANIYQTVWCHDLEYCDGP
jgi:hypothetical protein